MRVETKKSVTVIITLDRNEARWLKDLAQPTLYPILEVEPAWQKRIRLELFDALPAWDELNESVS